MFYLQLPNGICGAAELHGQNAVRGPAANGAPRVKDRPVNGVHRGDTHSSSTPTLPPSLRESVISTLEPFRLLT